MKILKKNKHFLLIFIAVPFLLTANFIRAEEDFIIDITTIADESISLSASWRPGGFADWHFYSEEPLDEDSEDSYLIYRNTRSVDYFYGRDGEKEIGLSPSALDRVSRIIWPNQKITGTIPEELTELEDFHRLDLSRNKLEGELPEYIEDFDQLSQLILDNNIISDNIPRSVGGISTLRILSLHDNELTGKVPEEIGALTNLEELYLHNNKLEGFEDVDEDEEDAVRNLSNLEVLTLYNNELESLPEGLIDFNNLYLLEVRNNNLEELFPNFEEDEELQMNMHNLEGIDASHNLLGSQGYNLPQELGDLTSLQSLQRHHTRENWHPRRLLIDLRYNRLTEIPETIGNLEAVDELRLDNNMIEGFTFLDDDEEENLSTEDGEADYGIPPEIGNLGGQDEEIPFRILSIYNNKIEGEIPPEIGDLENIKFFRAHNNNLSGPIPEEIFDLDELAVLNLENNELEILPDEENGNDDTFGSTSAENLQWLFMGRNELENIPEGLELPSIRFAHLEENKIDELPENFGDNFQTVQKLTLYKNLLTELPDSFQDLSGGGLDLFAGEKDTDIYYLDLGTNLIENFPQEVAVLEDLEYLNLSRQSGQANTTPIRGTMKGSIPEEIENLTELETFLIQNNELDHLPEDGWSGLSNLIYFYVQSNLLENLPSGMGDLSSLERLYLNNNSITDPIPDKLTETSNLVRVYLQYNQITDNLPKNSSWHQLERFLADDNEITGGIPDEFVGNLGSVVYFSIYRNELDGSIGEDIENMHSLRWWDMALSRGRNSTGLSGPIPQSVGNLTNLEMFDFNNNAITEVPDEIDELSSLENIYGFENKITNFADDIGGLNSLIRFDFHTTDSGNNIEFPEGVETLNGLKYFSLGENRGGGEVDWGEWRGGLPDDMLFLNNNADLSSGDFSELDLSEVNNMTSFNIRGNEFGGGFPED